MSSFRIELRPSLLPARAHPGHVFIEVDAQPEAQLGGVMLDMADVGDVEFGTVVFLPVEAGRALQ